ncbi:DNA polymerase domain-containing protein [Halovenus halobia]|uniref:DNA polymerase domain-containing protein n=1 Tax=Halovenus halobia TaxID=3396622 RepID=UPI003F55BB8E
MSQTDLGAFQQGDEDGDRPDAEARAIAGSSGATNAAQVDTTEQLFAPVEETVEMAVMQVDYTVEGYGDEEYPIIHVFGRTAEEELVHAKVFEFKPYFYAPSDSVTESRLQEYERITDWQEAGDDGGYESIRGEQLTKIFGQTPRDVGQMRDDFDHYEADILFPNRFLIDKDITSGIEIPARDVEGETPNDARTVRVHHDEVDPVDVDARPRVNTFDIEVDDRSGFPEDGEEPIICIASHDSYDDEYILWLYEPPTGEQAPADLDGYDPIDVADGATRTLDYDIRSFQQEEAMLEAFLDYFEQTEPDLATGWNFTDFDAPYLLDRLEVLEDNTDHNLDMNRLSRVNEVWRSDWQGPDVKGRVMFDLLYAYQRTKFTELDSYRLEDVGQRELGIGKERYPGDIGDLWEDNPERLLEYNLRDVELCVELDRDQDIIAFWNEVRQFVGCKIEDATTPGDAVDMYVLHKLHNQFALPSKGQQESEDYEGGAVFDPISGVRENVSVLDLKSLYPMCMVTINASPETKVDPEEYDGETFRAPNGTRFRKEPDGAIREMVDELLEEREQKKSLRNEHDPEEQEYDQYDRQQAAVKVIMNCFTPDTEVLTPDGVRGIRELTVGDEVYSLDPETMEMEVKPVTETHEYPDYRGELVDIQTSKIDFSVTPNHRMLVKKNDRNGITEEGWKFAEAGELYDYCHYEMPHDWNFSHSGSLGDEIDLGELARKHTETPLIVADGGAKIGAQYGEPNVARQIGADQFLELLAWYITEGNVYRADTGNHRIKIAQENETQREEIRDTVEQIVDYCYTSERHVQCSSRVLGDLLRELCGSGSENKRIPELVFESSQEQKEQFLQVLIDGDGDRQENSWRYSTKSRQLRDDVLRLCTHLGLTVSYGSNSGVWRIYCAENGKNSFRMHRDGSESTAEDGVYCVTVADNNTLLAGRNGKFQNVSNSLYGVLGWDRFRLYDKEMGAAVTATGRDVIEYTDEVVQNEGYEVVYGDTDSVMLEFGQVGPDDVEGGVEVTDEMRAKHPKMDEEELQTIAATVEKGFELEAVINSSYDEFALEELNAQEHRFEIEFEKLYRRFFQAGKKKRYAGHIVWKEGKDVDDIDITGFEHQRSDIAPITKEVQKEVIDRIVTGEDIESIKSYVTEIIEGFQTGEVSPEEIGIPGGIGKRLDNYDTDTAQVRGAKYANLLLGTNFNRGSKPKRVYLDRVHADFFERIEEEEGINVNDDPLYGEFKRNPDVICFEYADQLPEEFEIDWEKMLDKTLKGPIERILEALGVSWEEVKSGQEQKGLGDYM